MRRNSVILEHVPHRLLAALLLVASAVPLSVWPQAPTTTPQQTPSAPAPGPQVTPGPAVLVLDPAHGGSDSGARGPSGVIESEIVLDFARAIRVALEAQGFRVVLTREGNQGPSFDDRSAIVNGLANAIFISLHVSSTGPIGTARAYSYVLPDEAPPEPAAVPPSPRARLFEPLRPQRHAGLVPWDLAQKAYVGRSERLAGLAQAQLAQKLKGSPDSPLAAPLRQLRTIAAPAIAIEVSSVAVPDAQKLAQMGQPLAEAVARAVSDFRQAAAGPLGAER